MIFMLESILILIFVFFLGIILNDKIRDHIFYKFFWSPIDFQSNNIFYDEHFKNGMVTENNFDDEIIIINKTDSTLRINKINVYIKEEESPPIRNIGIYWAKTEEKLKKMMSPEYSPMGTSFDGGVFPISLSPNEQKLIHFGIRVKTKKTEARKLKIVLSPHYKYKKLRITYAIIFRDLSEMPSKYEK